MGDWCATDSKWSNIALAVLFASFAGIIIAGAMSGSFTARTCIDAGMEYVNGDCRQPGGSDD